MVNCKNKKTLVLKLGGQCNLNCKYCHCKRVSFEFNKDIFPYIEREGFDTIVFSGGEPLLYWKYIKLTLETLGKEKTYKIVTNATLLTQEIVEYFNKYNVHVGISYDGDNKSRDFKYLPKFFLAKGLKNKSLVTLFSNDNCDNIDLLQYQTQRIKEKYSFSKETSYWFNFVHQTKLANNNKVTRELAKKYCQTLARELELDFIKFFRRKYNISDCGVLILTFNKWIRKSKDRGVKCCRESVIPMTIDGKFLLCPYDEQYVGDIYTGIDWNKVESYIPDRCKGCQLWESCMNTCIANITENECYISKVIYKHFYKLMDKYGVDYNFMENRIKR